MDFVLVIDNKLKYDKTYDKGYDIQTIDQDFIVQYQLYKGLFMISPRDFVMLRYTKMFEDKAIVYYSKFETKAIPEYSGNVRAEIVYAGSIIERIDDNKSRYTLFSVADLKLNQYLVNTTLKDFAYAVKNIKKLIESNK